jgi:hypothetical protein
LHRLNLRSTALCAALATRDQRFAWDVVQGRLHLSERDAQALAAAVHLPSQELMRPLTAQEASEWRFYRISAAHHDVVWRRARDAWQRRGLSLTQAAHVMGFSPTHASLALKPDTRRRILALPPAARLADACALAAGAETFIIELDDPNPTKSDR